jgi:hypothetical protein
MRLRLTLGTTLLATAVLAAGWAVPSAGEFTQKGNLIVSLEGDVSPSKLPRKRPAPVTMWVSSNFSTTDGQDVPQLRTARIDLNRHGRLQARGLPKCKRKRLRFATTRQALRRCRKALVGQGRVKTKVRFPEQAPLPANGKLLAFNGKVKGKRAVITHTYGTKPVPVTYVLPFIIKHRKRGAYGTSLVARFPVIAGDWGFVTDFKMKLHRKYRHKGKKRSYLRAACGVPKGINITTFPLARTTFRFAERGNVKTGLQRDCRVRR